MIDDDDNGAARSVLAGFVTGNLVGGFALVLCGIVLGSAPFLILGGIAFVLAVVIICVS